VPASSSKSLLSANGQIFPGKNGDSETMTRRPLSFHQKNSPPSLAESSTFLLNLQREQPFDQAQRMRHRRRENFLIPNSGCRISLTGGTVMRKCFATTQVLANRYFWRNALNCGRKFKGG
jgi:hypothetical protein